MKKILILAAGLALSFSSCRIYDPLNEAGLVLTTEWSERSEGVTVPESYNVELGDYSATHTEAAQKIDHPFTRDTYRLHIWNPTQGVKVDGTVVTVMDLEEEQEPQRRSLADARENLAGMRERRNLAGTRQGEEYGGLLTGNIGWLFTSAMDADIQGGGAQEIVAPMSQQVGELTFIIEPTGENADRIDGIAGTLTGAAKKLDFDTGKHSVSSEVQFDFEKNADGKWQASTRLLGVTGTSQIMSVWIFFAENRPDVIVLDSDMTETLAGFNTNKKTPVVLGTQIVETPSEAGFTSTIDNWERIEREGITAE
ncbi:MAG: FimB/Mfa2 family fimbrial subunit [Alistipes sp.]|jgi:hypothetical protein|nr:FimB/Mfa2 family fimbrial subunit [Alistipes sp.]